MKPILLLLACSVSSVFSAPTDENPIRLASNARFDLVGEPGVESLDRAEVLIGAGVVERMNWVPESERSRGYTVNFRVNHMAWREFAVRFTPSGTGTVSLTLMGPWQQASQGVLYKEEVLWDGLTVEGSTIENGSFEAGTESQIRAWHSNGGRVEDATASVKAVDGRRSARTWHNATLVSRLNVTANNPVTVRGYARAAVPSGFQEMQRIAERDTPAHRAAKRYMRGANLGNYLEAPPGQDWGASYSSSDFDQIEQEGFDHLRLPIGWHHYTGTAPEFIVRPDFFAKADFLVGEAEKRGLGAIVNVHHFEEFTSNPAANKDKFIAIWRQLASHYAAAPSGVAFELLNEPKDAATTETMNPIYAEAIREIRKTNPGRTIFVGPGKWNQVSELANLRLPDEDRNLIVTVHSYDPFQFTHQGASWAGADVGRLKGIVFPGPPSRPLEIDPAWQLSAGTANWLVQYNTVSGEANPCSPRVLRGVVQQAKEWSEYYGRPVHMGEFGAYVVADAESRARYYEAFRASMDEAGIGWAIWDWKAGFRYWDPTTNQPSPGMRHALFPSRRR